METLELNSRITECSNNNHFREAIQRAANEFCRLNSYGSATTHGWTEAARSGNFNLKRVVLDVTDAAEVVRMDTISSTKDNDSNRIFTGICCMSPQVR